MQRTILRPNEVAELTGLSIETLKYWRQVQRGPAWFRMGRRVCYDLAALEAWLDEQRAAAREGQRTTA